MDCRWFGLAFGNLVALPLRQKMPCTCPGIWCLVAMKPVGLVFGFGACGFFYILFILSIYLCKIIINCMGVCPSILKLKGGVFPWDLAVDSEILGTIKPGW